MPNRQALARSASEALALLKPRHPDHLGDHVLTPLAPAIAAGPFGARRMAGSPLGRDPRSAPIRGVDRETRVAPCRRGTAPSGPFRLKNRAPLPATPNASRIQTSDDSRSRSTRLRPGGGLPSWPRDRAPAIGPRYRSDLPCATDVSAHPQKWRTAARASRSLGSRRSLHPNLRRLSPSGYAGAYPAYHGLAQTAGAFLKAATPHARPAASRSRQPGLGIQWGRVSLEGVPRGRFRLLPPCRFLAADGLLVGSAHSLCSQEGAKVGGRDVRAGAHFRDERRGVDWVPPLQRGRQAEPLKPGLTPSSLLKRSESNMAW